MSEIFVNTEQCRAAARSLRQASGDLNTVETNLARLLGSAADSWQGKTANAFIEKAESVDKQIRRLKTETEQLAADIDTAVSGYIETERATAAAGK